MRFEQETIKQETYAHVLLYKSYNIATNNIEFLHFYYNNFLYTFFIIVFIRNVYIIIKIYET